MATYKYFSGDTEVGYPQPMKNAAFAQAFPGVRAVRYDGFSRMVAQAASGELLPVTRAIAYKSNPSRHECGPKCRTAKGPSCECSCGGQFHGIDA